MGQFVLFKLLIKLTLWSHVEERTRTVSHKMCSPGSAVSRIWHPRTLFPSSDFSLVLPHRVVVHRRYSGPDDTRKPQHPIVAKTTAGSLEATTLSPDILAPRTADVVLLATGGPASPTSYHPGSQALCKQSRNLLESSYENWCRQIAMIPDGEVVFYLPGDLVHPLVEWTSARADWTGPPRS